MISRSDIHERYLNICHDRVKKWHLIQAHVRYKLYQIWQKIHQSQSFYYFSISSEIMHCSLHEFSREAFVQWNTSRRQWRHLQDKWDSTLIYVNARSSSSLSRWFGRWLRQLGCWLGSWFSRWLGHQRGCWLGGWFVRWFGRRFGYRIRLLIWSTASFGATMDIDSVADSVADSGTNSSDYNRTDMNLHDWHATLGIPPIYLFRRNSNQWSHTRLK